MRKVLKSSSEVFHFWANQVQSEGRVSNAFFEADKCYSYGRHFCIARILPSGVAAFTTRRYSNTTAKQISQARAAARHRTIVYCNDPSESAGENMRHAQADLVAALNAAQAPRIRQTTRDAHKADALRIAENANAYLAALPADERGTHTPIDTSDLESIRATMQRNEETARRLAADAAIARNREAADRLQAWKTDTTISTQGFHGLPVALRLRAAEGDGVPFRIQTSHGAEIPVSFAARLWSLITAAQASGRGLDDVNKPCGVYTLRTVRADGSIVVGCHDIPFSELQRIAVLLGYIESTEAAAA